MSAIASRLRTALAATAALLALGSAGCSFSGDAQEATGTDGPTTIVDDTSSEVEVPFDESAATASGAQESLSAPTRVVVSNADGTANVVEIEVTSVDAGSVHDLADAGPDVDGKAIFYVSAVVRYVNGPVRHPGDLAIDLRLVDADGESSVPVDHEPGPDGPCAPVDGLDPASFGEGSEYAYCSVQAMEPGRPIGVVLFDVHYAEADRPTWPID